MSGDNARRSAFALGFEAWIPPSDEELQSALRDGLVVIDTNVLLNLYKFHAEVTMQWFKIFAELGERLYLPHQVLKEFWRNRDALALYPEHTLRAKNAIDRAGESLISAYQAWIGDQGKRPGDEQEAAIRDIRELVERLQNEVASAQMVHQGRFDADPDKDEITLELGRLSSTRTGAVRVGRSFSPEELKAEYKLADERYRNSVPPGYMDDDRNPNTKVGKASDSKYGDYLVWRQMLDAAREYVSAGAPHPVVVFVTGDMKEDWWSKRPTEGGAKRFMARPELVDEMREHAHVSYLQIEPAMFLRQAHAALHIDVTEDAINSAAAVTQADDWLEPVLFLSMPRSNILASAQLHRDGEHLKVLQGSLARIAQAPTMPTAAQRRVRELLARGILVATPANAEAYEFTADHVFHSVSAAASIIRAASSNGNDAWITSDGRTPRDLRQVLEVDEPGKNNDDRGEEK